MPQAVKAMLAFYKWINIDPDLRLNEWLGFALVMPLVFGISFQTPLVMLFLNRIGIFGWEPTCPSGGTRSSSWPSCRPLCSPRPRT